MHAGEAEGPYMMQRFRHQHFRMDPRRRYLYGRRPRAILYGRRRPRSWRRRVVGALLICGMLLIVSAVLGKARTPRTVDSSSSQMGQHTQVIIVKDDTLPPVMQRIAQCESRGQHFTKDGQVVRGKRNPHDTGLFQINTVVWGRKPRNSAMTFVRRTATPSWRAISLRTTGRYHGRVLQRAGAG